MKNFFLFSVLYLLFATAFVYLVREEPSRQLYDAIYRTAKTLFDLIGYLPYFLAAFIALFVLSRPLFGRHVLSEMGWALAGCLVFSSGFTFMKTSLPYAVPFYADVLFADIDKALHGGVDPWVLTHSFADHLNADLISGLYFGVWGLPAAFFPLLLALCDRDPQRSSRFLILFGFVWIGLGNVVAYLGSSVGPVYYDRLMGTDRFAELLAALQTSGITGTHLGTVQEWLWMVFTEHGQQVGSGITAFPSVHNGIATLVMLYLWERSKWLAPIGIIFCAAILFASVYVGWHYAIDGYFSIIAVTATWFGLKKFYPGTATHATQQTPRKTAQNLQPEVLPT